MDSKNATVAIHIAGVAVMVACFLLGLVLVKSQPAIALAIVGAGWWLYGKLGFKPADPVLVGIVQKLATPVLLAAVEQKVGPIIVTSQLDVVPPAVVEPPPDAPPGTP